MINADEIAGILKQQIASFNTDLKEDQVGTVIEVGDSIARVYGLDAAQFSELVEFPNGLEGIVLNLEEDNVGVIIMGPDEDIKEGDRFAAPAALRPFPSAKRCSDVSSIRSVTPIDGKGPIDTKKYRTIENTAPGVIERQAGQAAVANRLARDRRARPDRERTTRADHRRPWFRQNGDRDRHDHQPERPRTSSASMSRSGKRTRRFLRSRKRSRSTAR